MRVIFSGLLILLLPILTKAQKNTEPRFIIANDLFCANFNANKNYSSLEMRHQWEWSELQNTGFKSLTANLFLHSESRPVGVGISIASRDTDVGTIKAVQLTASREIPLGESSRIVLGLGVGLKNDTHYKSRMSKFQKMSIKEFSYSYNKKMMVAGVMVVLGPYFAGTGINTNVGNGIVEEFTGIDWRCGRFFNIDDYRFIRLLFIGRRYKYPYYNQIENKIKTKFSQNQYNLSIQAKVSNKLYIGTEVRFQEEFGLVLKHAFFDDLLLGYEYDLKIGNDLNKLNSHLLTLSYTY